jgi:hypothetical protein
VTVRLSKVRLLLGVAVGSGALLVISRGPWLLITTDDALRERTLSVPGVDAAPAVGAAALVCLACAGALSIAGPRARSIIAVVSALAAALAVWATAKVLIDAADVVRGLSVGDAAGASAAVPSADSDDVQVTMWPSVGLLVACLLAVWSGLGASSGVADAAGTDRFTRAAAPQAATGAQGAAPGAQEAASAASGTQPRDVSGEPTKDTVNHSRSDDDAAKVWDALSRGKDPTV